MTSKLQEGETMGKQELIDRLQRLLDIQEAQMLEYNGRPDCKNCSLAEAVQALVDEAQNEAQHNNKQSATQDNQ